MPDALSAPDACPARETATDVGLAGRVSLQKVKAVLDGALLGTVNFAEVVSHYAKFGASRADIDALLRPLPIRLIPADPALSFEAGLLRPLTIKGGLSLGDRYCLALAKRENVAAMTAERRWADIAKSAGVRVELIR